MEIKEKLIIGKQDSLHCEDAYVVTPSFIAVVDGSTSKSMLPSLENGLTHGQIAARCVCDYIRKCPADIGIGAFCEGVTAVLHEQYGVYRPALSWQHLTDHPEDRFTCSAIIFSSYCNEVWMIGDCHCLLIDDNGTMSYHDNAKPLEAVLAAQRAAKIQKMLAAGASIEEVRKHDEGRAAIIPALKASMKEQNHGYAVIDGFEIPMDKVKIISTANAAEIVLASDGYPCLFPTLLASEKYLRNLLDKDPLLMSDYQATKAWHPANDSFDDRCYVRFSL